MTLLRLLSVCIVAAFVGAACTTAQPVTALPPPTIEKSEVLGAGDVIEVRVFNEPDLSGTHQISENGTIRLPLVGVVEAAGVTPDQLTLRIQQAFNERYLKDAEVSLFVKEHNWRKVYVLGQVNKPGPYPYDGRMTVIDAVALAGGTTKLADANGTKVTRTDKDGKQVVVVVRAGAIGEGREPDIELQPGDIVFVPETPF
jgi:polysaccharide export outer membrane protein